MDCNFTDKDEMIRDRLVFGVKSQKIREKLINEGDKLTLDRAIQIFQSFEYAQEQLREMNQAAHRQGSTAAFIRIKETVRNMENRITRHSSAQLKESSVLNANAGTTLDLCANRV